VQQLRGQLLPAGNHQLTPIIRQPQHPGARVDYPTRCRT
jgi:hypothetical protein